MAIVATGSLVQWPLRRIGLNIALAQADPMGALLTALIVAVVALATLAIFVRTTEGEWPTMLSARGALHETALGMGLAVLLSALCMSLIWALGGVSVVSVAAPATWAAILLAALPAAIGSSFVEETLARGVFLRQLAWASSPGIALVISALLFGLAHLANPGATIAVAVGLAVQAGLLLGCAYLLTGRLWAAIGLHFAWNFMQAGVIGGKLSGNAVSAIITAKPQGADWLSGGAFGIEGSLLTTLICGTAALAIMVIGRRSARARYATPVQSAPSSKQL